MFGRRGLTKARLPNGRILKLESQGDEWSTNLVFWYGWDGFETPQARAFFRLARDARVFLDVGANNGYYSLIGALANPAASIYAFEPLPPVFDRLVRNVELNALTNVHPQPVAVSDHQGTARLFLPAQTDHTGIATLEREHADRFQEWDPTLETDRVAEIEVELTTMDAWASEIGIRGVDLVKIDVEQHESHVLEGMADVLGRNRPDLFCEVLNPESGSRISAALEGLDYAWYALTPERAVAVSQGGEPEISREHFLSARGTLPEVSPV